MEYLLPIDVRRLSTNLIFDFLLRNTNQFVWFNFSGILRLDN